MRNNTTRGSESCLRGTTRYRFNRVPLRSYLKSPKHDFWSCSTLIGLCVVVCILALLILFAYGLSEIKPHYSIRFSERKRDQDDAIKYIDECRPKDPNLYTPPTVHNPKMVSMDCKFIIYSYEMNVPVTAFFNALHDVFGTGTSNLQDRMVDPIPWFCGEICRSFALTVSGSHPIAFIVMLCLLVLLCFSCWLFYTCYSRWRSTVDDIQHQPPPYIPSMETYNNGYRVPEYKEDTIHGDIDDDGEDGDLGLFDLDDIFDKARETSIRKRR